MGELELKTKDLEHDTGVIVDSSVYELSALKAIKVRMETTLWAFDAILLSSLLGYSMVSKYGFCTSQQRVLVRWGRR